MLDTEGFRALMQNTDAYGYDAMHHSTRFRSAPPLGAGADPPLASGRKCIRERIRGKHKVTRESRATGL
jgi:hypothetical protein